METGKTIPNSYLVSKRELLLSLGWVALLGALAVLATRILPLPVLALLLPVLLVLPGVIILRRQPDRVDRRPRWSDLMPCYLTVQDADYNIIDGNEPFRRDFGHRGGRCYQAYKDADVPCPSCCVQAAFADGRVHTCEESVLLRDGSVTDVLVTAAPLPDADGKVTAVMKTATDITEVKTLRRELEQTRGDFERLFAAVPCFICVQDRQHSIIEANALYRREFGAAYGSRCWEVCKHRSSRCPDCLVEKTFADGQIHSSEEVLTTQDGRRINVVVYTRPVLDDNGEIIAVMEVFTDITEVKSLQRQLALMGRAVAGMAHRIKNIVMGLEGGIFVVNTGMETDDKETISEGWEMVERNVQRVSNIVKDLLYCAKDRPPQLVDGISPHEIMLEVRDLYAERMAEQEIDLVTEVGEAPPCGRFDPEGLHSLLCNLVANSIDACRFDLAEDKERHTITLRCFANGTGATVLEVEDDGAGIPEELNSKVFEDYFSSKGTEGTGIGLLVVQKVAEEHGGKVNFTSRPGVGTTFTVTIPNRAEP